MDARPSRLVQVTNRLDLWERWRKLYRLLGANEPPQEVLATLAGDTRSPGVPVSGAYRRFAGGFHAASLGALTSWAVRADVDLILTVTWSQTAVAASPTAMWRLLSPAQAASLGFAFTAGGFGWTDNPDGGDAPVSIQNGGPSVAIGAQLAANSFNSQGNNRLEDVHLPPGWVLAMAATQLITNPTINLRGYPTGR